MEVVAGMGGFPRHGGNTLVVFAMDARHKRTAVELGLELVRRQAELVFEAVYYDFEMPAIALPAHEQDARRQAFGYQLQLDLQFRYLGDIPNRPVEPLALVVFPEVVHVHHEARKRSVCSIEADNILCTVQAVLRRTLEQVEQLRNIVCRRDLLDGGEPRVEIGNTDRLVKLFVEANDIDGIAAPEVEGNGTENVVEHGVAVHVLIEELAQSHLLVQLHVEPALIEPGAIADEFFELGDGHGAIEIVSCSGNPNCPGNQSAPAFPRLRR